MSDPDSLRIVIADDHAVVRTGLRRVLEDQGWEVVAEAADAEGALRVTRGHKPDVLVLDLSMPGATTSLDVIPRVIEELPGTRVVVLTMQDEPAFIRGALGAGATAYVLKEAADAELVDAIRLAARGEGYLNPRLGARLAREPSGPEDPPDNLTGRETEVLELIALGHTNAEIAEKLFLSVRTIETHRTHIQRKTNRSTRAELVDYALRNRLVRIPT
ncbi:MAG TPA: response regulator transcription factor [Solirubrobacteraceae bacterium]|jgi:two-component system response regulator NreC|nr:response regulator transcription factor [Solirubrobacteraceae bacterium]